jgi:glycosyltransferase involved in cell wall biosynthesis
MPWYNLSDLNAELLAIASCLAGRTDIVHFLDGDHSPQFLPRLVRFARLSKIRTVVTFHQPPRIAREVVNRDLLRWVDHIVLVSPSQLPFFLEHVPEDRLHVILHGIDIEFFRPPESRREYSYLRCVTVGHWLREWNVLRQVVGALPEVRFDVVTGAETGLSGFANVHIHRGIDDATLAELYRTADVLLLPLVDSTANNALLEGMASGLPVVTTDLPAVRTYLPNDGGLLVPNNSVEGFVAALQSLRQDIPLRHAMGGRTRARAEELAWPRLVPKYEALYTRVLRDVPIRPS